ncbi:MAG: hypothetical protein MO852_07690 [Candidatus Devosia euplotis]|nr:hypothetical protein [Candidatus Devosia euplotis]
MAVSRAITALVESMCNADRRGGLGMVLSAALPLSVFVIANGLADLAGIVPVFLPLSVYQAGLARRRILPSCHRSVSRIGWSWPRAVRVAMRGTG